MIGATIMLVGAWQLLFMDDGASTGDIYAVLRAVTCALMILLRGANFTVVVILGAKHYSAPRHGDRSGRNYPVFIGDDLGGMLPVRIGDGCVVFPGRPIFDTLGCDADSSVARDMWDYWKQGFVGTYRRKTMAASVEHLFYGTAQAEKREC
jgi:hypothetical protein